MFDSSYSRLRQPVVLLLIVCMLTLAPGAAALAQQGSDHAVELDGRELARYHALNAELRCLICQNRSIAESDAPLAKDLRQIVERQIAAGRSDAEIKRYLVERYGDWVLYDPPFTAATLILWVGPFLMLGVGLLVGFVMLRRRRGAAEPDPKLDRGRLARLLAEEQRRDNEPRS